MICGDKRNRRDLLQHQDVETALPSKNIYAYISFVVPREQKINARITHFEITKADLRKELRQEWLRKHESPFRSKNLKPETRLQQQKYSAGSPCLGSARYLVGRGRFTGSSRKAAEKFRKPV